MRLVYNGLALLLVASPLACTRPPITQPNEEKQDQPLSPPAEVKQAVMAWPKDWSSHIGQLVSVEGIAIDQKVGTAPYGNGETIFIDDLDSWPAGYYFGQERGKRVRVTGTVIERHDLPVFIRKDGELPQQGIPVPEGTDLRKASRRFLIRNAKWSVIE